MEITADQHHELRRFLQDWLGNDENELETTFGPGGTVDITTFLQISQRLRDKGFTPLPQEDRLNILTPSNIRFTLQNLDVLQSYCKDDSLEGKAFTAMFKDRKVRDSNLDLKEYDIRFKTRREQTLTPNDARVKDLLANWPNEKKAFRLIRRWSFLGNGIRVDMSIVRQTPSAPEKKGEYLWTKRFLERNIFKEIPRYEVEVELVHDEKYAQKGDTVEVRINKALKDLISGVGEVQRAIQRNSLLIRNSVSEAVRKEYQTFTGSEKFRGVNPVTLEVDNMSEDAEDGVPNIRGGFNVTDKADGLRTMAFVNKEGELFLIDMSMKVYRTGLKNLSCAESLLDGEWVTRTKEDSPMNNYLIFDIYSAPNGENMADKPFITYTEEGALDNVANTRYNKMRTWYEQWRSEEEVVAKGLTPLNRIHLSLKKFKSATAGNTSIFQACADVLDTYREYYTDGLILTSNSQPIPEKAGVRWDYQFKWKPAQDNTIDFLVNYERNPNIPTEDNVVTSIDPNNGATIQYKTMRLFVGGSSDPIFQNPRSAILMSKDPMRDLPKEAQQRGHKYQPILFNPLEFGDTMANICNIAVEMDADTGEYFCKTEHSKEPIPNGSIVEMRYDPKRESGWRWVPYRIRHDKTERLQRALLKKGPIKYSGTMNDEKTANSVWNSIHHPVTLSMIRSGDEEPLPEEVMAEIGGQEKEFAKVYYDSKASEENIALVRGLRDFHNQYIKNDILLRPVLQGGNKFLLDLSCGKAGDLNKWVRDRARYVVGVDISRDNITNPENGAYRRYLGMILKPEKKYVPKMAFLIGDSSLNLVNGEAGATQEEKDMMRSIFGVTEPEGVVPPYIQQNFAGLYRRSTDGGGGTDVAACMFALHYFFENEEKLSGFLQNLADTVKVGGYFVGACFDGNRVFNLLTNEKMGHSVVGKENDVPIWTITKQYSNEELTDDDDSVGLGIDVEFISIGATHREYLVPFEYFRKRMRAIGFETLTTSELKEFGLRNSTNTFDRSYAMAEKEGKTYSMTAEAVKEYSFLHRWFIFKRVGEVGLASNENEETMRFGKDITKENATYELFNVVSSSAYSVLKPWHKERVNSILLSWFQPSSIRRIVDATAHIGVDTINMSNTFPFATIDAFEIDPLIFSKLQKNIQTFKKEEKIIPHLEDVTTWEPDFVADFLFVDPPWGGENYLNRETIDLYLQKEGNAENASKNVNMLIDKWLESGKVRNVVMKAPRNFDKTYLLGKYSVQEEVVKNRAGGIAFTLLRITPSARVEAVAPVEEEKKGAEGAEGEVAEELKGKIELELGSRLPSQDRTFAAREIFRFGIDVDESPGDVRVKKSDGKIDPLVARWMSLIAPFPLPDPENPDVFYPSVEHYLAAMKLKKASNRPDLAEKLFGSKSALHQKFLTDRQTQGVRRESESDFDLLEQEAKQIRSVLTKTSLNKYKIVAYEDKWDLMKDEELKKALEYRWKHDQRFHDTVEAARTARKYLLYSTKTAPLELGGKRSVKTGKIEGENKVGRMIMEIAEFQF